MLLYGAWVIVVILLLGSCQAGQRAITPEQQAQLDAIVESRSFRFEVEYAMPLASQAYMNAANLGFTVARGNSVSQISLAGDGYFLEIDRDTARSHLPYFGVRENITDYAGRGSIEMDGPVSEFHVRRTPKGYEMEFQARDDYERFRMLLSVEPNLSAQVSVFSPQRDVIRYSGKLRALDQ